ncbi:hypothetical protein ACFS7Z_25705 [Pontibacter toksunensis]|uniref:Uncharacterized protein n=1 Tax=Pontibacter toksunensis TaxID=1332631 RepID=A0ABW6C3H5_9BACT
MKTRLALTLLLLTCCLTIQAQGSEPQFFPPASQNVHVTTTVARPLVVIDAKETTMEALILDKEEIQSIKVYKGDKAVEKFGRKGKDGVVVMELKEAVPLARLAEVLKHFNVTEQAKKLTIAIDGRHVPDPELLLADLRQISKVEVTGYDVTSPSRWTFDEEYLNIVTVQ